ncbi:PilW family protein [Iodobacter sp.]|uniref:PilW family protein n=1 Tax=Iodobacter sp. TaxID=1915058 RepID=UPI0025CE1B2A|nr:PilW family protein [Iodobacter sp.]
MYRNSGFGLIEVLISLALTLLATIAIYQIFNSSEGFRRATLGNGNAQSSGGIAIMQIQKDIERAGYGIGVDRALNCNIVSANAGFSNIRLVPAIIESAGTSDRITLLYSDSPAGGMPALLGDGVAHTQDHNQFANVQLAGQFIVNDLIVAWPDPGKKAAAAAQQPCQLYQVTCTNATPCAGAPVSTQDFALGHAATGNIWNTKITTAPLPVDLPAKTTRLFDFGSMVRRTYCVYLAGNPNKCPNATDKIDGSLISMDALDRQAALDGSWKTTTENVIQMQAQYGLDTNADGDNIANNVTAAGWTKTTPTTMQGWKQLIAIRYAVLVRSATPDKPKRDDSCDTTAKDAKFIWAGGEFSTPENAQPSDTNWQCYHYSVHETIVPLRNQLLLNQPALF